MNSTLSYQVPYEKSAHALFVGLTFTDAYCILYRQINGLLSCASNYYSRNT